MRPPVRFRTGGRRRRWCPAASPGIAGREAEVRKPAIQVAAAGIDVVGAARPASRPATGAGLQGMDALGGLLDAEGGTDGTADQLRTGGSGLARSALEEVELIVAEIDLGPGHDTFVHLMVSEEGGFPIAPRRTLGARPGRPAVTRRARSEAEPGG
jgi:hypothetical protein